MHFFKVTELLKLSLKVWDHFAQQIELKRIQWRDFEWLQMI